jgi:hypothetical protein
MDKLIIEGKDNYGKPRQEFADRIAQLDDSTFLSQMETIIWLSAYANNNKRSDYHWQAQHCYSECKNRNKLELYDQAYDRAMKTL